MPASTRKQSAIQQQSSGFVQGLPATHTAAVSDGFHYDNTF